MGSREWSCGEPKIGTVQLVKFIPGAFISGSIWDTP